MRSKASIRKELDSLWYEIGHQRFKKCLISGVLGVEIHHLIPKSHHLFAWDLKNQCGLSPYNHRINPLLSAHGRPKMFRSWLKEWEPELYEYLIENEHKVANSLPTSWYKDKLKELKEASNERD